MDRPSPSPLTPDQVRLAERWRPLALSLAGSYAARNPRRHDDVVSAFYEALVLTASGHDPGEKDQDGFFVWKLKKRVRRAYSAMIADERRRGFTGYAYAGARSLKLPACEPEAPDPSAPDPSPAFIEDEAFEALTRNLGQRKCPRRREVFRLIYRDGLTQAEAAKRLGVAERSIAETLQQGVKALAGGLGPAPI